MEETLEQKKRRLYGKKYLSDYLLIMQKITSNIDVLCRKSIPETDSIIEKISFLSLKESFRIVFDDKNKLKNIVFNKIKQLESVYIFTSFSQDCGVIQIPSLKNFNFDFEFSDDLSGIISLVTLDLKSKILLDFYKEDNNEIIEIEIYE